MSFFPITLNVISKWPDFIKNLVIRDVYLSGVGIENRDVYLSGVGIGINRKAEGLIFDFKTEEQAKACEQELRDKVIISSSQEMYNHTYNDYTYRIAVPTASLRQPLSPKTFASREEIDQELLRIAGNAVHFVYAAYVHPDLIISLFHHASPKAVNTAITPPAWGTIWGLSAPTLRSTPETSEAIGYRALVASLFLTLTIASAGLILPSVYADWYKVARVDFCYLLGILGGKGLLALLLKLDASEISDKFAYFLYFHKDISQNSDLGPSWHNHLINNFKTAFYKLPFEERRIVEQKLDDIFSNRSINIEKAFKEQMVKAIEESGTRLISDNPLFREDCIIPPRYTNSMHYSS